MAWVATAIVGSAVVGAGATMFAADKAADAQTQAAERAADTAMSQYSTTREDLAPYRNIGADASGRMATQLTDLTAPIELTQDFLDNSPGYQFALRYGKKAVENSAAARGLGVSGAVLRGAAEFATGLADQTYKTQFDVANTNKTNAFNRLKGLIDTGAGAAAQTGSAGTAAANTAAGAQIGAGNAQGAAYTSMGGAVSNMANNVGGYAMYKGLYGNKGSNAFANSTINNMPNDI